MSGYFNGNHNMYSSINLVLRVQGLKLWLGSNTMVAKGLDFDYRVRLIHHATKVWNPRLMTIHILKNAAKL